MIDRLTSSLLPVQPRTTTLDGTQNREYVFKEQDQQTNLENTAINREFKLDQKEKVEEVLKGLNDFLNPANTSLKFEFHEELKEYYVTVVDNVTQEVVREIPAKKLLDTYAAMTEFLGILIDKKI